MATKKKNKQYLLKGLDGALYLIPKKEADSYEILPKDLARNLKKVKAQGVKTTATSRAKIMMTDIAGVFYSIPPALARKHRVPAEDLPQILKNLSQEMPKVDWKNYLAGKRTKQVAAKAVDVGISTAANLGAAEALQYTHNCCIKDCCVIDCCIMDCSHAPCPQDCRKDCQVQDPYGCHPVQ